MKTKLCDIPVLKTIDARKMMPVLEVPALLLNPRILTSKASFYFISFTLIWSCQYLSLCKANV